MNWLYEIIFMSNAEIFFAAPPPPPPHAVTVAVAVDENYVPHLGALIESIKEFFSKDRFLDFIVLDGGVSDSSRILLEKQFFQNFSAGKIAFINCKNSYQDIPTHSYFTETIFYRISIGKILSNHRKILYLDTDITVLSDISVLFDNEMGENFVGASYDLGIKSFIYRGKSKKVPKRIKGPGGIPVNSYVSDYLGLGEFAEKYFQTGVMLFNLDKFRTANIEELAINDLSTNKYWLPDQDVLNKHLKGKIFELDTSWNCLSFCMDLIKSLPPEWAEKARKDFLNPKIVHYAGSDEKPWNNADAPLAYFYWFFLRRTFWYEQVLKNIDKKKTFGRVFRK